MDSYSLYTAVVTANGGLMAARGWIGRSVVLARDPTLGASHEWLFFGLDRRTPFRRGCAVAEAVLFILILPRRRAVPAVSRAVATGLP